MGDKYHRETDKINEKILKEMKQIYSQSFNKCYAKIKRLNIDGNKTITQLMKEKQYQNAIRDMSKILEETNKKCTEILNKAMKDIYVINYNGMADLLGVNDFIKRSGFEQSPYTKVSIDNMTNQQNCKYIIQTSVMNGIKNNTMFTNLKLGYNREFNKIANITTTTSTLAESEGRQSFMDDMAKAGNKVTKTWVCIRDSKTRDAHMKANGQTVPYDECFIVDGEELMYPADPNGSPDNINRCRCMMKINVD